jgi:hypothetical protein
LHNTNQGTQLSKLRLVAVIFALGMSLFAWGTFTSAQNPPYVIEPVGKSVQGRPFSAYRFGNGPTKIAFIGGIHQGDESNSTELIEAAIKYFSESPGALPRELTVYFLPNMNPDGFLAKTRTNSRKVDLNRNWPTKDWKADTYDAFGLVKNGGGSAPLSEPENVAVWNYIQANNIISVIWYHARGGMVVDTNPTANGYRHGTYLARLMAGSTGYEYKGEFNFYEVTGDASDFLNSKGIYSMVMELTDYTGIDWKQNLRGFTTAINFFKPYTAPETGRTVSGQILAYWKSNGAEKTIGLPTGNPLTVEKRVWQEFQRGVLVLDGNTGLVSWLQGRKLPTENLDTLNNLFSEAKPPTPLLPIGPGELNDPKSRGLRERISNLQNEVNSLQTTLSRYGNVVGNPVDVNNAPPADFKPPDAALQKAVKVVIGPNSTATVYAYEKGKLVRTIGSFSGKQGYETPRGDFKIRFKHPNLQTNRWYEEDGTEYFLKNYASFTGAKLGYSDDWAFHQMRIPVSGPQMGQVLGGGTHGCLALSPADATWFYSWADEGTPVTIY